MLWRLIMMRDVDQQPVIKCVFKHAKCREIMQRLKMLVELCQPVAGVASRQHLRSAAQRLLVVPPTTSPAQLLWPTGFLCGCMVRRSGIPCRTTCVIRLLSENSFRQSLKTFDAGKTRMIGLPYGEKLWRYVKPFSSDTGTSRTDGQTDKFVISISQHNAQ